MCADIVDSFCIHFQRRAMGNLIVCVFFFSLLDIRNKCSDVTGMLAERNEILFRLLKFPRFAKKENSLGFTLFIFFSPVGWLFIPT